MRRNNAFSEMHHSQTLKQADEINQRTLAQTDELHRRSVRPLLMLEVVASPQHEYIGLRIVNVGVGPAVVKEGKLTRAGEGEYDASSSESLKRFLDDTRFGSLFEASHVVTHTLTLGSGIRPGEHHWFFRASPTRFLNDQLNIGLMKATIALNHVGVVVSYSSIYEDDPREFRELRDQVDFEIPDYEEPPSVPEGGEL